MFCVIQYHDDEIFHIWGTWSNPKDAEDFIVKQTNGVPGHRIPHFGTMLGWTGEGESNWLRFRIHKLRSSSELGG
jgi:hypothetical protein